jgi:hypothetical protein
MAKAQTAPPPTRRQAAPAAKASVPARQEQARAPAKGGSDIPAHLVALQQGGVQDTLSQSASDNLIPLVYILQPLSPQVMARNPAQIQGAEPGDIWLRNAADPIHKEIWFQPCHFSKDWVEWIPRARGGGYAGRHPGTGLDHDGPPVGAQQYRDPENPQSIKFKMPNGNDVVQTRYFGGNIWLPDIDEPLAYIIPLSSTGHTFGKAWNVKMNQRRINGERAKMWSSVYHLITTPKSNNKGEWYMFENDDVEWASEAQWQAGEELAQSLQSGAKVAEAPMMGDDLGGNAGEDSQGRM